MLRTEGKLGMTVSFGTRNGEKTLGEIVKINRKNFKVRTLEERGKKRTHEVGSTWTVPPSICTPVHASKAAARQVRSAPPRKKQQKVSAEERARQAAKEGERLLQKGCDLSNPPTYIKASRRYLDGTTLRKNCTEYDGQKSMLYRAEYGVQGGKTFGSIAKCQKFLDKVMASAWFNRRFNLQGVRCEATQGWTRSYCRPSQKLIRLLDCHMNELTLLHELTHAIVPKPHSYHGRLFCAIYLDLVRHFIGEEAYEALLAGYRRNNVKYQPHRSVKR